jgi:hypothetical protein
MYRVNAELVAEHCMHVPHQCVELVAEHCMHVPHQCVELVAEHCMHVPHQCVAQCNKNKSYSTFSVLSDKKQTKVVHVEWEML